MPQAYKLIDTLVDPRTVAFALLVLGTWALWTKRDWIGRGLVTAVVSIALLLSVVPLGSWLLSTLENRFPAPSPMPERVDGIVVLGGDFDAVLATTRRRNSYGDTALPRIMAMAELARRYPEARIVYSGGVPDDAIPAANEAHTAAGLIDILGLDRARVTFEDRSRNTYENAMFSLRVAAPETGQTWLLVTSAFHMPRAVGAFRRAGWQVIPYPVDYWTGPRETWRGLFAFDSGLRYLAQAVREFAALFLYSTFGLTDQIIPGPRPG
jgi:uncharacterized SAM-binding protein YcdF (DUF218 family)